MKMMVVEMVGKKEEESYPQRVGLIEALGPYVENPLSPLPMGATTYFVALYPLLVGTLVLKISRYLFRNVIKNVDLYPKNSSPPSMKLIWMQQSRREANFARLDRTAWTWLAKKYMMFPSDPSLNVTKINAPWENAGHHKCNIWPTVEAILKVNALHQKLHTNNILDKEVESWWSSQDSDAESEKFEPDGKDGCLYRRTFLHELKSIINTIASKKVLVTGDSQEQLPEKVNSLQNSKPFSVAGTGSNLNVEPKPNTNSLKDVNKKSLKKLDILNVVIEADTSQSITVNKNDVKDYNDNCVSNKPAAHYRQITRKKTQYKHKDYGEVLLVKKIDDHNANSFSSTDKKESTPTKSFRNKNDTIASKEKNRRTGNNRTKMTTQKTKSHYVQTDNMQSF